MGTMMRHRLTTPQLLTRVLVVAVMFSGFVNLIPSGGYQPGSLLIDGLAALMLGLGIWKGLTSPRIPWPSWLSALCALLLVCGVLILASPEPTSDKLLYLRSHVAYAFIAAFVMFTHRRRESIEGLIGFAMKASVLLAGFGILQYVGRSVLPEMLLKPIDADLFGYFGTDIIRSNGLIGNTIVFVTVLLLFFALHCAKWAREPNVRNLIPLAIIGAAIVTTFSRSAMVGAAVILVASFLIIGKRRKIGVIFIRGLILGWVALFAGLILLANNKVMDSITNSFIYQDLFLGGNASVQGSNAGHNANIKMALEAFNESPFIGVGIATQGQDSVYATGNEVITDGAFWQILAEGGILLLGAYSILLALVVRLVWKVYRRTEFRVYAFAFLAFSAYLLFAASFVNSAVFGKPVFILFWVMFGALAGVQFRVDKIDSTPRTRQAATVH